MHELKRMHPDLFDENGVPFGSYRAPNGDLFSGVTGKASSKETLLAEAKALKKGSALRYYTERNHLSRKRNLDGRIVTPQIKKAIKELKEGRDVTVSSYEEADKVLFGAFPDIHKVGGSGSKSFDRFNRQRNQFRKKDSKYHKDYRINPEAVREALYGHEILQEGHSHKNTPHINVKRPTEKKVSIYINLVR